MGKIILTSTVKGEVVIRTEGFKGSKCIEKSKWLENALGTPSSTEKTSEYYEAEVNADLDVGVDS